MTQYIVTNFAYGTGPYLRTTDLTIAFNDILETAGHERLGIIVPWVYGEKQKCVMLEEFEEHERTHPGEILLDAELGAILKSVFYGDAHYEEALTKWVYGAEDASQQAHRHLQGQFTVETFGGAKDVISGKDIVIELNRSPRIRYDIAPSYFTSFAYIEDILEHALHASENHIAVGKELLRAGMHIASRMEGEQVIRAIAYPATFSYSTQYTPRYLGEILTPPIAPPPHPNIDQIDSGIFVTVTGIPGLERLYGEARRLGLKLYSNDSDVVPGSIKASPHIIPNKSVIFQFARSGWSSVWLSMISGTPLVVPEFDSHDDPEIYFNNSAIESLGIGIIYRGQPLEELLAQTERMKRACTSMTAAIHARWGTLDGNRYCAELFAKDFLRR